VPQSDWAGKLAGRSSRPTTRATRSRHAGWASTTAPGIHGTTADDSIGTAASHGCVRMRIPDVVELYDQVPVEAPVYIA
jgi:lipoprotein-anchoring transpeptidase ErfK/SrfK